MAAFNYAVKVENENGFSENYFTEAEAIAAWNTRAAVELARADGGVR